LTKWSSKQALNAALEASGNELSGSDLFEQYTAHLASDQLEQDTLSTKNPQSTGQKGEKKNQSKLTQNEDNSFQGYFTTPALQKLHNIAV
jgi:hypothetical protein